MVPSERLRVLLVEDNPGDVDLVKVYLSQEPTERIELSCVDSLRAARDAIGPDSVDLVLLDLGLPDGHGLDVVGRVRRMAAHVPIVVLTGRADSDWGLEALKRDAQDYLIKDHLDGPTLRRSIHYAIERHRWQQQYRHQLSVSPDGMLIVGERGAVRFANTAAEALLGFRPKHVRDLPEPIRLSDRTETDVALGTGRIVESRSVATGWQGERACLITLHDTTERRRTERALSVMTDELKRTNERLQELVTRDPLTDVLNRRGLEDALGQELARMSRSSDDLSAIMIDYDDFKGVNDAYGHAVGDAALRALTHGLRRALRAGDHVGRVGGDEFLVLLPSTSVPEGSIVAEKLRRTIKRTALPVADGKLALSASLAVGAVEPDVISLEQILAGVNLTLGRSKRTGKDRVSTSRSWVQSSRGAAGPSVGAFDVASIDLSVALQTIREVGTEDVVGFEALIRGPRGRYESPIDLFAAAFDKNVLTTLDLRALTEGLDVLERHPDARLCHVNLLPSTILNTPMDRLLGLLDRPGLSGRLAIELSEQQFLGDPSYLIEPLEALREAGIHLGIDDVGYGRSSVEALIVLQPDVVKVDRSCVSGIADGVAARRRLERLIGMLSALDADIIVEGVETAGELDILRELGVLLGQGFLWGKPRRVEPA